MKMEQKNNIISYLKLYQDLYSDEFYVNKISPKNHEENYCIFGSGFEKSNFVFLDYFDLSNTKETKYNYKDSSALLDKMLKAINLKREDIYIITFLKYDNLKSLNQQYSNYKNIDYKLKIKNINPSLIILLGKQAYLKLLSSPIENNNNLISKYYSSDLIVTLNPLELLKDNSLKRKAWSDFKLIRDKYINV